MEVLIRSATAADAEEICSVHIAAIRKVCCSAYDPAQIESWAGGKSPERYLVPIARHPFFVAVVDEYIIGFCDLDPQGGRVLALYVHPAYLRQTVGNRLLQAAEAAARDRSLSRLRLRATLNAIPFYEANGYTVDGMGSHTLADGTNLPCADMHKQLES